VRLWPYAVYLSRHGLQALAIDLRCFGRSACPQTEDAKSRMVNDVAGAVAELRRQGARWIGLVGASIEASTALLAGAALRPSVACVVSLSTGKFDLSSILGGSTPLDTGSAARRLTVPVLFVVARDDPNVPLPQVRALYRLAKARDKRLEVPRRLLRRPARLGPARRRQQNTFTGFAAKVAAFVATHTRS
jgi:pimeloyl-ACP methyl ester carboxylesterase